MKKKHIIIPLILIIMDQLTKYLIVRSFNLYDKLVIINNFLNFEYVQNTGISFGFFSGGRLIIIVASIFVIGFMIYELIKGNNNIHNFSCTLILSGAVGNLIDRIFRGYVVDFISFIIFNHKMAIFNIADTFVVSGVILYIILMFVEGKKNENNSSK